MQKIEVTNYGDYSIFDCDPSVRVYLGSVSPKDYIHDYVHQEKRSASCYHDEETGEYICPYDFKRKTSFAYIGGKERRAKYDQKDPAMKRLAWAFYSNKTLEEYDEQQEAFRIDREAQNKAKPSICNLMTVSGRSYYVDDNHKEITSEEHTKLIKAKYGDDCFEKEFNATQAMLDKLEPVVRENLEKLFKK